MQNHTRNLEDLNYICEIAEDYFRTDRAYIGKRNRNAPREFEETSHTEILRKETQPMYVQKAIDHNAHFARCIYYEFLADIFPQTSYQKTGSIYSDKRT